MLSHEKGKLHQLPENPVENGLHQSEPSSDYCFLSGIKQRLLSFIFRGIWNEEPDQALVGYLCHSMVHCYLNALSCHSTLEYVFQAAATHHFGISFRWGCSRCDLH